MDDIRIFIGISTFLLSLVIGFFIWLHRHIVQQERFMAQVNAQLEQINRAVNHVGSSEKTLRQWTVETGNRVTRIEALLEDNSNAADNVSKR